MKLLHASLLAACAPLIAARFVELYEGDDHVNLWPELRQLFLIETAPGKTQWVTEEEKWEMRRVRAHCPPPGLRALEAPC